MNQKIFRKVALERLSSPEQLDQLFQVTSPRSWLVFLTLALFLGMAIFWSLTAQLPLKVKGQGILLKQQGIFEVAASYNGQVSALLVKTGQLIPKGQPIARMLQTQLLDEIQSLKTELSGHPAFRTQNKQLLEQKLRKLQEQLRVRSQVVSPYPGRVVEIVARLGQSVQPGTPIIRIELVELLTQGLEAVLYLNPLEGKKIQPGMLVELVPSTVKLEEYGFILGRVEQVSRFPASNQGMLRTLKNQDLVRLFTKDGAPTAVTVSLMSDPGTRTGYRWSSQTGPSFQIHSGTLCTASIVTERQSPFRLMFLYTKKKWQQMTAQQ